MITGVSVLALAATIIIAVTRGNAPQTTAPAAVQGLPERATTDISQMSPEERATRLFNRIMEAATAGDTAQIQFFAPMALNAYAALPSLDADARFHVGTLHLMLRDADAAMAQGDSIRVLAATHLFGSLLRARAAEANNDRETARQAYRKLLADWDAEQAKNLTEYQQHSADLEQGRTTARGMR